MNNTVLYLLSVLIWGSTWIAITYQLGTVAPVVSIAHRFLLAALFIFAWLLMRREFARLGWRDHGFMYLQGLCLFCVNYLFIYTATETLTSGLVAVVFSSMVILNMLNGALFLGLPTNLMIGVGALVGMLGMVGVFLPELEALDLTDANFRALLMCLAGTFSASLGNVIASRHHRRQIPVLSSNAWGMLYGSLTLYLVALLLGEDIVLDLSPAYLLSLGYLSIFGSVVAFWAYLTLIGRMGADRASYINLIIPVVALLISTLVEGYQWSLLAFAGLCLVLLGNWLVMRRGRA